MVRPPRFERGTFSSGVEFGHTLHPTLSTSTLETLAVTRRVLGLRRRLRELVHGQNTDISRLATASGPDQSPEFVNLTTICGDRLCPKRGGRMRSWIAFLLVASLCQDILKAQDCIPSILENSHGTDAAGGDPTIFSSRLPPPRRVQVQMSSAPILREPAEREEHAPQPRSPYKNLAPVSTDPTESAAQARRREFTTWVERRKHKALRVTLQSGLMHPFQTSAFLPAFPSLRWQLGVTSSSLPTIGRPPSQPTEAQLSNSLIPQRRFRAPTVASAAISILSTMRSQECSIGSCNTLMTRLATTRFVSLRLAHPTPPRMGLGATRT